MAKKRTEKRRRRQRPAAVSFEERLAAELRFRKRVFAVLVADGILLVPGGIILIFTAVFRLMAEAMGSAEAFQYPMVLYEVSSVLLFLLGVEGIRCAAALLSGLSAWEKGRLRLAPKPGRFLGLTVTAGITELVFATLTDGSTALHLIYLAGETLLAGVYYYGRYYLDRTENK